MCKLSERCIREKKRLKNDKIIHFTLANNLNIPKIIKPEEIKNWYKV